VTALIQPEQIQAFRLLSLRQMLILETKGMRRRGRSALQIVKGEFNLTGDRKKVLGDFEKILEDMGIKH
jgi:hypothetical protein